METLVHFVNEEVDEFLRFAENLRSRRVDIRKCQSHIGKHVVFVERKVVDFFKLRLQLSRNKDVFIPWVLAFQVSQNALVDVVHDDKGVDGKLGAEFFLIEKLDDDQGCDQTFGSDVNFGLFL